MLFDESISYANKVIAPVQQVLPLDTWYQRGILRKPKKSNLKSITGLVVICLAKAAFRGVCICQNSKELACWAIRQESRAIISCQAIISRKHA